MDILRKKYKRGEIDQKTYREKVTELTILHLESIHYEYIGKIADGTHGVIVELKSPNSSLRVAVKIVIDEFATDGEMNIWPNLINNHILPLIKWENIAETDSKAFFSLKYPATLENKLEQDSFLSNKNGFENAVSCIKCITNGIHYLHQQGLCHMNLQPDHIVMKNNYIAKIGSFGYLTSKDTKELKYGASAVFCPPEAYHEIEEEIDGQKFDIWSLGILATEVFTGKYLTKEIAKWKARPSSWYFELYSTIYDVLEKEKFKKMVKKTYKNSIDIDSKIDQVLNFITSCLILNPGDRPSAENLLKHQLIGGNVEKYYPKQHDDIWNEKVNPVDLLMIGLEYKNQSTNENNSNCSKNMYEKSNDVILDQVENQVSNEIWKSEISEYAVEQIEQKTKNVETYNEIKVSPIVQNEGHNDVKLDQVKDKLSNEF